MGHGCCSARPPDRNDGPSMRPARLPPPGPPSPPAPQSSSATQVTPAPASRQQGRPETRAAASRRSEAIAAGRRYWMFCPSRAPSRALSSAGDEGHLGGRYGQEVRQAWSAGPRVVIRSCHSVTSLRSGSRILISAMMPGFSVGSGRSGQCTSSRDRSASRLSTPREIDPQPVVRGLTVTRRSTSGRGAGTTALIRLRPEVGFAAKQDRVKRLGPVQVGDADVQNGAGSLAALRSSVSWSWTKHTFRVIRTAELPEQGSSLVPYLAVELVKHQLAVQGGEC